MFFFQQRWIYLKKEKSWKKRKLIFLLVSIVVPLNAPWHFPLSTFLSFAFSESFVQRRKKKRNLFGEIIIFLTNYFTVRCASDHRLKTRIFPRTSTQQSMIKENANILTTRCKWNEKENNTENDQKTTLQANSFSNLLWNNRTEQFEESVRKRETHKWLVHFRRWKNGGGGGGEISSPYLPFISIERSSTRTTKRISNDFVSIV